MGAHFKPEKQLIMDTLKKAIKEWQKAKKENKLGVLVYMDKKAALRFIAQQAQDIDDSGRKFNTKTENIAYLSTINQFGETLVNAAIELYNS